VATLDNEDIQQIEEVINKIINKSKKGEHIREGKKERQEKVTDRIHLIKDYGLALWAAGLPLFFAGIVLVSNHKISVDLALLIGGISVTVFGFLCMSFAKWIANIV
jgi:hypothetical protein